MGTVEDAAQAAPKAKLTILVPQRGSEESFFAAGLGSLGFSPGPMTLVSSFFAEHGTFSFSQLLAGAMASPMAPKRDFSPADDNPVKEEEDEEEEEGKSPDYGENPVSAVGYKRNRPINLVVAQPKLQQESLSPPFMVPPDLSPSGLINSPGFLSPLSPFGLGISHQQALAHVTAQASLSQSFIQMQEHIQRSSFAPATDNRLPSPTNENSLHHSNPTPAEAETFKIESPVFFSLPQNKKVANVKNGKPASDGYNWRKYGQKHVKASECPRSYYKCTHVSCPVKKKVELSLEGHVLEIVYKGQHNHAPPQNSNKRGKDGCGLETNGPDEDVEVDSRPVNPRANLRLLPEQDHVASWDNGDVENNVIVVADGDDEEPIAKRRKMTIAHSIPVSTYQTITESKIVVQTRSEVDLLDDGYKWRKYGQKVVKGNPYPRSYYKCTYAGCNVRKHVERAPTDPKAVITTYEGKHNHEIPSGRHSAYANANPQPLKAQRSAAKNLSEAREMDFGNQDKIPVTLLKEEQIAT